MVYVSDSQQVKRTQFIVYYIEFLLKGGVFQGLPTSWVGKVVTFN